MLTSSILGYSAVIQEIAEGRELPGGPCGRDVIRTIRLGLITLGFTMPDTDILDDIDPITLSVLSDFKRSRGTEESRSPIDAACVTRLDYELSFLEGIVTPQIKANLASDSHLMRLDPLMASFLGTQLGINGLDKTIIDRVRKMMELGDRMCFRLSTDLLPIVANIFNEQIAEPRIFKDFCAKNGPCNSNVFFDISKSLTRYRDFLILHNPGKKDYCFSIGKLTRPDILSHRPPDFDWYEIKPSSMYGLNDSLKKLTVLLGLYLNLPYKPGRRYKPTKDIVLGTLITPTGGSLKIILEVELALSGIIFWALCIEGDYVEYFNRYQIVTGLLQILIAIGLILPEVAAGTEAGAAILTAIRGFAVANGIVLNSVLKAAR